MARPQILTQKEYKRMERKVRAWMRAKIVMQLLAVVALIALLIVMFGFIIALAWGLVMPSIFGLPTISPWQGLGLFVLSGLIITGPLALAKIIKDALSL